MHLLGQIGPPDFIFPYSSYLLVLFHTSLPGDPAAHAVSKAGGNISKIHQLTAVLVLEYRRFLCTLWVFLKRF